jgi:hypothetical protein
MFPRPRKFLPAFSASPLRVCLLVSLVILVIMDRDRAHRGLITISQKPMLELRNSR